LHNDSPRRHWLDVRVAGRTINRMGIGSQVRVYRAGGKFQPDALLGFQEVNIGYGYASRHPAICHFGLGNTEQVDLRIDLPNGRRIDRTGVAVDRLLVMDEPE